MRLEVLCGRLSQTWPPHHTVSLSQTWQPHHTVSLSQTWQPHYTVSFTLNELN